MRTKILITLMSLACLLVIPARAQVNYAVSGTNAYVTSSPNASGDIVIASTYNGYPVTGIGGLAFSDCTSLTNVTIPNSVTSIGLDAFSYCTSLTSVTIPTSVTSIGYGAFENCTGLTSVTIPNSVTDFGDYAFYCCTSLTNVTIPDGVTDIGWWAFQYDMSLTSVTIPTSITNIGTGAFSYCSSLRSLSVDAANPVYSSVNGVLFDKAQTTLIAFPAGGNDGYSIPTSVASIGNEAFSGCTGLTNVTIPNSVTSIGSEAFSYCASLTSVTIPDSVTSIGEDAFSDCTGLTNAIIGNSVTNILSHTFYVCTNLMNLTFAGNAPALTDGLIIGVSVDVTVYYYYGTTGWGATYGGLPTVMLADPAPQISTATVGLKPGGFGFTLTGVGNQTIVVEASSNLVNWQPLWTNTLSGASVDFVDPQWSSYPRRFYRASTP